MTREEAVKILNTVLCFGKCDCSKEEIKECLKMAIKALEQVPCEDAISRQIISDYVGSHIQEINAGYGDLNRHTNEILRMIVGYIESMPPVTPKPKTDAWSIKEWSIKEVADSLKRHGLIREQQPCEDAVSRQAVKDILDARGAKAIMTFEYFKELLDKLPPVSPQPKTGQRLCRTCIYGDKTEYDKPCIIYSDNCQLYRADDVLGKIRAEIKEWYWQADKQALAKDPCVVDAMVDLFIRTINKYKAESEVHDADSD